jgi:hypothetical protein
MAAGSFPNLGVAKYCDGFSKDVEERNISSFNSFKELYGFPLNIPLGFFSALWLTMNH